MTHHVFVYGTLKRGEPNHCWLTLKEHGQASFICEATTSVKYPLLIATRFNIPFLLFKPGTGHHVQGEIYKVDDKMLSNLDILEDHPEYYTRTIDGLRPKGGEPSDTLDCWVYFLHKYKPQLLELPFLQNYSSKGDHGLPYAERSSRDPNVAYIDEVRNNESTPDDLDDVLPQKPQYYSAIMDLK